MEKLIARAIKLTQELSEQSLTRALNEFEHQMYEHLCRMIATYCRLHELMGEKQAFEMERELALEREQHEAWLKSKEEPKDDTGT